MNKKKTELEGLRHRTIFLESENTALKMEHQELRATIARLKTQLSESRMRQADLVERSRGIHIL